MKHLNRSEFRAWLQAHPLTHFLPRTAEHCPLAHFLGRGGLVYTQYYCTTTGKGRLPEWAKRFVNGVDRYITQISTDNALSVLEHIPVFEDDDFLEIPDEA